MSKKIDKAILKTMRDEKNIMNHLKLGMLYKNEGYYEDAISSFRVCVKMDADKDFTFLPAYMELGDLYLDMEDYENAKRWYGKATDCDYRDLDAKFKLALITYKTGDYINAEEQLNKILDTDDYYLEAYDLLIEIYKKLNMHDKLAETIEERESVAEELGQEEKEWQFLANYFKKHR